MFSLFTPCATRFSAAMTAAVLVLLAMTVGRPVAAAAASSTVLAVEITSTVQDRALAEETAFLLREGLLDVEGVSVLPRRLGSVPALPTISGRLSRAGSFSASLAAGEGSSPPAPVSGTFDGVSPFNGADRIYESLLPGLRRTFPKASWPPSLSYPTLSTEALHLYIKGLMATDEADRLVLLTQSEAADPSFAAPLVERGRVFLAAGAIDAAMDDFRLALESRPGHREAHTELGRAYRRRGDTGVAESHFREALRTDPLYGEAKSSLDEMLGKGARKTSGKPSPVEVTGPPASAAAVDGNIGEGHTPLPRRSRSAGSGEGEDLSERAKRQLDDIELEMELFLSVGMEKEAADARRRRDELMEKSTSLREKEEATPRKAVPAAGEEVPRQDAGDPVGAIVSPAERLADDYRRRGEDAMRRGQTGEAVELFEAWLSAGGGDPDTIYVLAELHLQLGQYARSRELFSAAARAYEKIRKSGD